MNIPVLHQMVILIEEIFRTSAPIAEKAAVASAVGTVEADPKVQAIQESAAALLIAARGLKSALNKPSSQPSGS